MKDKYRAATSDGSTASPTPTIVEPTLKATNLKFLPGPITSNPKDELWSQQWAPRAIKSQSAWAKGVTGKCVRVAVVDGGLWWDHPDLVGRVDVDYAKSFWPDLPPYFDSESIRDSGYWHASHVAGIVVASANNNDYGVVGIAPEATIVPVKVCDGGQCDFGAILQGIIYAASAMEPGVGAGADVINLSLGAYGTPGGDNFFPWDFTQQLAAYSNFGSAAIWVAAPGGDTRAAEQFFDQYFDQEAGTFTPGAPPLCYRNDFVLSVGAPNLAGKPAFAHLAGTSMATPAVSGAATLVIHDEALRQGVDLCAPRGGKGMRRNPTTPGQVKAALARGAVLPNGGADRQAYGSGIVDVPRTLGYPQPVWAA
ncbi:hypothetical protein HXX76_004512 [Chlamydomonas incerta]|uniref:Peptidase S8/S53 domain-containing protein n=1 Tax=Chlamydomonas incerta TaxID=51695 RepID=A0A835TK18_CHLIN|nr:hypothetical protein HXX76_004512 [Chlamydomonas incerta]|eukprot:KAG2439145.1 hypothetical protein HXX76_004512 [Chlamydomonas incerta]